MVLYQRQTRQFIYDTHPIKRLLKTPPKYGLNAVGIERYINNEPRYIRITDIDDLGRLKNTLGKTADDENKYEYGLNDNDILLARSGATVGKCYIHKVEYISYPCFYAGYMIKFAFNEKLINPDYFFYYTQLTPFVNWVSAVQRVSAQPNINAQEYQSLKIPVPPSSVQNKIIKMMKVAYKNMAAKEKEAENILSSIDTYLSKELELPAKKTSPKKIFIKEWSDVLHNRWDAFYHSLEKRQEKSKYVFYRLDEYANLRKGETITKKEIIDGDIPVIAGGQTSPYKHNRANTNGDIVTVSSSGTAGYVWYHAAPVFASDCTIIASKNQKNLHNKYMYEWLKFIQQDIYNLQRGAIQPHVYATDLVKLKIPLPPISKQKEIARNIAKIRQKADKLIQSAHADLEKAKRQVEKIILGE